jgi:peptidoglycan/xylan/chitin deacetylase (PgdA/CDA1 family)
MGRRFHLLGFAIVAVAGVILATACAPAASPPVVYRQACNTSGRVTVTFLWTPGLSGGQWVDLSIYDNNFAPGTFLGTGPLAKEQYAYVWDGLAPNTVHYLRIDTDTAYGWRPSATLRFRTPDCGTRPKVVLSFDDGGDYAGQILDTLRSHGATAIFFPTGQWAQAHPDLVARMTAEGNLVGDHTYSHAHLTTLTADQIRAEIAGGNVGNSDLFRPPFGEYNSLVTSIARSMGFRIFLWNIDPGDYQNRTPGGEALIISNVMASVFPNGVVILHMEVPNTPLALPTLIDRLEAAGYGVRW